MILTHAQTVHVHQAVCIPSLRPEIEATGLFDVSDVLFCILLCTTLGSENFHVGFMENLVKIPTNNLA